MWGCKKCGQTFTDQQVGSIHNPTCPACGPDYTLRPWAEHKNWTFLLIGLVGLPLVGRILVTLVGFLVGSSPVLKQATFFVVPAVTLLINLPSYIVGLRCKHHVMKRGGEQGLLVVAGFIVSVVLLLLTGYYAYAVG